MNEYRPWDYTTEGLSDTVSITVSDAEDQTGMTVGVTITLDADHMYMTLVPFVEAHPNPTEAEIREAISGNLCRCTGYQHIVQAVQLAAQKMRMQKVHGEV